MAVDGMTAQCRIDLVDLDVYDQAVADDVILTKLNKYYLLWHAKELDGRRLSGVTATESGLMFPGFTPMMTTISTDWIEVASAFIGPDPDAVYATPLEIVRNPNDIFRLQAASGTFATPRKISFHRRASTGPDVGRFDVSLYPVPDVDLDVSVLVHRWPPPLVLPTDIPDVSDLGAYTIPKLAAAELAGLIGEDQEFVQHVLRDVSDETMAQLGIPRPGMKRQQEVAA